MIISPRILSKLFRTDLTEIKKFCSKQLKNKIKFRYLSQKEKDLIVIKVINKIIEDKQIIGSKGRKQKWHDGWNEAFKSYSKTRLSQARYNFCDLVCSKFTLCYNLDCKRYLNSCLRFCY